MVQLHRNVLAGRGAAISAIVTSLYLCVAGGSANAEALYASVGERTRTPPIGWAQFCQTYQTECKTKPLPPRVVVLSEEAWNDLKRMNQWVNHNIKPITDMDHYGMIQWWRYPDDGAGACHRSTKCLLAKQPDSTSGFASLGTVRSAGTPSIFHALDVTSPLFLTSVTVR